MIKSIKHTLSAALLGILAAPLAAAHAEYTGPSNSLLYTSVADVLQRPVDDAPIALNGRLIRRIDRESFIFADDTAEIEVEIEPEDLPHQSFDDNRTVRLQGEIETRLMRDPEIEVERLILLPNAE